MVLAAMFESKGLARFSAPSCQDTTLLQEKRDHTKLFLKGHFSV